MKFEYCGLDEMSMMIKLTPSIIFSCQQKAFVTRILTTTKSVDPFFVLYYTELRLRLSVNLILILPRRLPRKTHHLLQEQAHFKSLGAKGVTAMYIVDGSLTMCLL